MRKYIYLITALMIGLIQWYRIHEAYKPTIGPVYSTDVSAYFWVSIVLLGLLAIGLLIYAILLFYISDFKWDRFKIPFIIVTIVSITLLFSTVYLSAHIVELNKQLEAKTQSDIRKVIEEIHFIHFDLGNLVESDSNEEKMTTLLQINRANTNVLRVNIPFYLREAHNRLTYFTYEYARTITNEENEDPFKEQIFSFVEQIEDFQAEMNYSYYDSSHVMIEKLEKATSAVYEPKD